MSKNKYSIGERFFSFLISVLCVCAVILVAALVIQSRMEKRGEQNDPGAVVSVPETTPEPLTLSIAPTATPENFVPAPVQTPVPTRGPSGIEEASYDYLPVYTRADTEEKVIAITVDDCSHQLNVRYAAMAAAEYGAKLTLFPYGQSVMQEGMTELLRACVNSFGYQVENRTWSNAQVFQLENDAMATEIWAADVAADYVLGGDYEMRFLRMRSGSGSWDTRTHAYLKQLGYDGIVNWSVSSNGSDIDKLQKSIGPGKIYQFTSSQEDVQLMIMFMKFAHEQGYRMVTLNELLGYEANELTLVEDVNTILTQTLPTLKGYEPVYVLLNNNDRAWQVLLVQRRLAELGYLAPEDADGIFGAGTASAISKFQAAHDLMGTGIADTQTQQLLFADE